MADDVARTAVLNAAYERLARAVAFAPLESDSQVRQLAIKTLEDLRQTIEHDPHFVDELIVRLTKARTVIQPPAVIED